MQQYHMGMSRSYFGEELSTFLKYEYLCYVSEEIRRNFAAGNVGELFLYENLFYF